MTSSAILRVQAELDQNNATIRDLFRSMEPGELDGIGKRLLAEAAIIAEEGTAFDRLRMVLAIHGFNSAIQRLAEGLEAERTEKGGGD
jgi:ATP-dependent DNA ligase